MAATVFKALAAVTATGAGTALDLGLPMPIHSMQVKHTGSPSAVVVNLEGSLDGVNFIALTAWDSSVQANSDIVTASAFAGTNLRGYPVVKFIRANLATLTGGTAPTVMAVIGSFGS